MGIHSYRAEQLAVQARRWTLPELEAALDGLVDLDAIVKNAPGYGASEAQRRLAFTMWLAERVGSPAARPLVSRRPGLLLDDQVALDREDAAALAQVEQLDQVRVDVELVAVLAEPARDPEAEPLAPIGHAERRVEPRGDEAAAAAGTAFAKAGHRR